MCLYLYLFIIQFNIEGILYMKRGQDVRRQPTLLCTQHVLTKSKYRAYLDLDLYMYLYLYLYSYLYHHYSAQSTFLIATVIGFRYAFVAVFILVSSFVFVTLITMQYLQFEHHTMVHSLSPAQTFSALTPKKENISLYWSMVG